MPTEHILQGLEPDNLLAFLALLGFHRALDHAEPTWRARTYWAGVPLRPRLVVSDDLTREEILDAAARGCAALAEPHSFAGKKDINFDKLEARQQVKEACEADPESGRLRMDLLSALMSDGALQEDRVRATPFCAMFGQGHQHFLERLEHVPKGLPPKDLEKKITAEDLNSPSKLAQALFQRWERSDRTPSFRWDPAEDRRYALRFEDPSEDKGLTVHGANRLASLALPLLTAIPKWERGEVRLRALGTSWDSNGLHVLWPVWSQPASLKSVVRMVAGCGLSRPFPGLGIIAIYRSERISVGKFFNFTRGVPS